MSSINYIIPVAIILLLALGLVFLPDKENHRELPPEELLQEMQNEKRFISVEQLTEMMIQGDPTLILIDLRDTANYNNFSLPAAIHIPFGELLNDDRQEYFDREELQLVFYSNDHLLAEQAWLLMKRKGLHHFRILRGGLNQWTQDILLSEPPPETAPTERFDRYAFFLGARKFFVGASTPIVPESEEVEHNN